MYCFLFLKNNRYNELFTGFDDDKKAINYAKKLRGAFEKCRIQNLTTKKYYFLKLENGRVCHE